MTDSLPVQLMAEPQDYTTPIADKPPWTEYGEVGPPNYFQDSAPVVYATGEITKYLGNQFRIPPMHDNCRCSLRQIGTTPSGEPVYFWDIVEDDKLTPVDAAQAQRFNEASMKMMQDAMVDNITWQEQHPDEMPADMESIVMQIDEEVGTDEPLDEPETLEEPEALEEVEVPDETEEAPIQEMRLLRRKPRLKSVRRKRNLL